ncbi:MAG: transketolase C-terminal domain-containing protein, partial [Candidatus Cloacimonetes bacterium]|nr:transketolase C-terminal domain-containing protein [Candidatus Cloacimonadota bacterium]
GLSDFERRYPKRFFDVGIAEQHAGTLAAGMATKGIKPFVAIYSTFAQRALDQIIHDVAMPKLPIVLCLDRAGIVGEDGATHQGAFDLAFLSYIPNLVILAPSCAEELSAMLAWAALYKDGPVAIRYPRGKAVCRQIALDSFTPGQAEIIQTEADISQPAIAFVAVGEALQTAQDTAELLAEEGIKPLIVNLRSIKPMDERTILALCDGCKFIFSFENGSIIGGVGARIAQLGCGRQAQVINFGYPDEFIPHGKTALLKAQIGFEPQNLARMVQERL